MISAISTRAVVEEQEERRRERDRAQREAGDAGCAAPQDPVPADQPRDQHQAEDDQALRELLDGDDQCERQSGEEQQQRSGCREPSAGHSIISRP